MEMRLIPVPRSLSGCLPRGGGGEVANTCALGEVGHGMAVDRFNRAQLRSSECFSDGIGRLLGHAFGEFPPLALELKTET